MFYLHKVFLLLAIFLGCCLIVSNVVAAPKADTSIKLPVNILATLNASHPRLLVKSLQDFENLKRGMVTDPYLAKCGKVILNKADSVLVQPPVEYYLVPQLGGQLLETSRKVYRRIYNLSMAYRLTGEKKYVDRAWKELLAASQFPDWNPWHFLDVSEMLHGFAIGYDWLYDVWTPEQRKVIKQAIVDKGLLRGILGYDKLESVHLVDWINSNSNWNQVCSAGVGMGALAIADEEPLLSNRILQECLKRLPNTMNRLEPDGASEEGPGYWKFGTQYNVVILASLQSALGTDFGLSKLNGFSKSGEYFLAMAGSGGRSFNYADCWTDTIQAPELFWFAKQYNQPLLAKYQFMHPEYTPTEMLWYTPPPATVINLPVDNYFHFVEAATIRTAWNDPDAWFVGFKGGHNAANHSHLDIGDFVLERNGKRWAIDLSHDSYALPGYFDVLGGQRWTYYRLKAEGHNTLVINPDNNPDQNPRAVARIEKFISTPTSSFGIIDMTDAYPGKVSSAKRGILLQDKKRVIVQDEISSSMPINDLYWFMQTQAGISISDDKKTASLVIDNQWLKVQLVSPGEGKFEILDAKPLPASIQPAGGDPNNGIKRLTVHLKNTRSTTISIVFKDIKDNSSNKLLPLSKW